MPTDRPLSSPHAGAEFCGDGSEPTTPITPAAGPAPWSGADITALLAAGDAQVVPSAAWAGAEPTTTLGATPHPRPATSTGPWSGADVTAPLGAGVPKAHAQITAEFAPFPGTGRIRKPVASAAPSTDTWHREGQRGPLTGQVFGDYELGTILGEGGMGIIYRARQASLGRRVAVKTLATSIAQDPVQRSRFELEARAASLVRSPHVVQVFAAGSHNEVAYFVMEYVAGQHLGNLIQERVAAGGGLDPAVAAGYLIQAARGLAAAAGHGIVHRDIKPANLLITVDGQLKIADFGISRIQGENSLTRTGTAIGTPSYVSPEQGRGEACDARADLYSLGVVFYECLTGQKPFTGDSANAVIYQHSYAEPKLPRAIDPQIPEHYQAVVLKCLQKDPANRYQAAADLVADLERIATGNLSLTAVFNARFGTGADEAMRRYLGRRRTWLAPTLAAVLALGLGGAGTLWWRQQQGAERAAVEQRTAALRQELRAVIDPAHPVPASARADLDRFATLAGSTDPDLQRWRTKLTHVTELSTRLGRLDQASLADAALAAECRADLTALTALVGSDQPGITRWRTRLQETAAALAELRSKLAVIDQTPVLSLAQRAALAPDLARCTTLAGSADADITRWRGVYAAADRTLADLHQTLAALDGATTDLPASRLTALATSLDAYLAWRGTGFEDADAARWRARLATHRERLAALRASLATLDGTGVLSQATNERLAKELATYATLVEPNDPERQRWERLLGEQGQALAAHRARCAVLDRVGDLTAAQLAEAHTALDALRPLVAVDDPEIARWQTALATAEAAITADRASVALLAGEAPLTRVEQQRAAAAITALGQRQLADEAQQIAWRRRLVQESERLADLRRQLAVCDAADPVVTHGLVEQVLLFGRLAGSDDPDYTRWYAKIIRAAQLREALAPLDQAVALPERAGDLLAEYAGIIGRDDHRIRLWRAKLDRVAELRTRLAPLDRVAPVADDGRDRLQELVGLIGEFPGADAWRQKLERITALRLALSDELGSSVVRLPPSAREHLALLGSLIGTADPRMRAWTTRLAFLAGPGQPAWATRSRQDEFGFLAELELESARVSFRYIPPGTFRMGSPAEEPGRDADEAQVEVTLTAGMWLATEECRQDLYRVVTGTTPAMGDDPEGPVQRVSWPEVQAFIAKLNARVPTLRARLPTEAEWEHAARAGDSGAWQGPRGAVAGTDVPRIAWFLGGDDAGRGSRATGRRQPNGLGLADMQGNVWEWCADRYGVYSAVPVTDPIGIESDRRVARGGSWGDGSTRIRVANRLALDPDLHSWFVGFRLAATAELPPEVRLERATVDEGETAGH